MKHALVKDLLPALAGELRELLKKAGRGDLSAKVDALPLIERCRCGDDFCSTFYTAAKPVGAYGPGHSNLQLSPSEGMIILDLVDDDIRCVEVLDRPEVQRELFAKLP
jgi:hypothetical protein